jgi:hypothetical protein
MGQSAYPFWEQWKETIFWPAPAVHYLPLQKFTDRAAEPDPRKPILEAVEGLNAKAKDFLSSEIFSRKYLVLIGQAQAFVDAENWSGAHVSIWEATLLVNRALATKGAGKQRFLIGSYAVVCFAVLFGLGLWFAGTGASPLSMAFFGTNYVRYMLMGALGGVTAIIWGLVLHTIELDFDPNYSHWYTFKPFLGALAGLMAVLVILGGFLAIQASSGAQETSTEIRQLPLYVIAFLAGFSERFFMRLLDRVISALFAGESTSAPARAPVPTTPSTREAGAVR